MYKNITPEDLLLFAYNETGSIDKYNDIKQAVRKSNFLKKELVMILKTKKFLENKIQFPRKDVIDNILNYSKVLRIIDIESIGKKSIILN